MGGLAKQFGVAESEVRNLVSSGHVNFSHLQAAFESLSGAGGKFEGMMAKQSLTLGGLWSTLKDNANMAFMGIAQAIIDGLDIKDGVAGATAWIGDVTESIIGGFRTAMEIVGPIIRGLMPLLGGLGTLVMSVLVPAFRMLSPVLEVVGRTLEVIGEIVGKVLSGIGQVVTATTDALGLTGGSAKDAEARAADAAPAAITMPALVNQLASEQPLATAAAGANPFAAAADPMRDLLGQVAAELERIVPTLDSIGTSLRTFSDTMTLMLGAFAGVGTTASGLVSAFGLAARASSPGGGRGAGATPVTIERLEVHGIDVGEASAAIADKIQAPLARAMANELAKLDSAAMRAAWRAGSRMGKFDGILSCSIGGAAFNLRTYTLGEDAIMEQDRGRTGTKVTISGEGWIEGTDAADYAANVAAVAAAFRTRGFTFGLSGLGGATLYALAPVVCRDGGPDVAKFSIKDGKVPLQADVSFTISAETPPPLEGGTVEDVHIRMTAKTETRPDGLRTITYAGEIRGAGATAEFTDNQLPALNARFDLHWVMTKHEVEQQDQADTHATFTVVFTELSLPLPFFEDAQVDIVDGEQVKRVERDEQLRKTTIVSYDLLVIGDPFRLVRVLRPPLPQRVFRERYEFSFHRERRLRYEYTLIEGADGNALLEWDQSVEFDREDTPIRYFEFEGRPALASFHKDRLQRITQRGRAVGVGLYPVPPSPLYPERQVDRPVITFRAIDFLQRETTWSYRFALPQSIAMTAQIRQSLERPVTPQFYDAPAPANG